MILPDGMRGTYGHIQQVLAYCLAAKSTPKLNNTMTTTTMTKSATQLLSYFVSKDRNEERYWYLVDDVPDEVTDLVHELHDDELPNDWRYETIVNLLHAIKEQEAYSDELDIDSLVSIYNGEVLEWLTPERLHYVDEAKEEYSIETMDIIKMIRFTQYMVIQRMANQLQQWLEDSE